MRTPFHRYFRVQPRWAKTTPWTGLSRCEGCEKDVRPMYGGLTAYCPGCGVEIVSPNLRSGDPRCLTGSAARRVLRHLRRGKPTKGRMI